MSEVTATPPTTTTPTTAAQPVSLLGTISDPPGEITRLAIGHLLRGVVSGHDANGRLLVRTDYGMLAVTTQSATPYSGEVVLQIRSAGARLQVLILQAAAADGQAKAMATEPPSDVLARGQNVRAVLQAAPSGTSGLPLSVAQLPVGSQLQVRVVSAAAPSPAASLFSANPLPANPLPANPLRGSPIAAGQSQTAAPKPGLSASGHTPITQGTAGQYQAGSLAPQPASTTGAAAVPALTQQPSGTAGRAVAIAIQGLGQQAAAAVANQTAAAPATNPLAPATNMPKTTGPAALLRSTAVSGSATAAQASQNIGRDVGHDTGRIGAHLPPQVRPLQGPLPQPAISQGSAEGASPLFRFTGMVSTVSHAGYPVVQTPLGTLTLELRMPLPPGSSVVLELATGGLPKAALSQGPQSHWPALEEWLAQAQAAGVDKAAAAAQLLPQAGPKLASTMLLFMSVLRGGEVGNWLRPQLTQLQVGSRGELASRLGRDIGRMTRQVDSGGSEWRLFLLPFLDNGELEPLRFFLRDHGDEAASEGDDKRREDATRFVIEIEFSKLGGLQIDGLLHHKQFDLILRSERPLPQTMRQHITGIFQAANEAAGLGGRITFETPRAWHFLAVEDGDPDAHAGLVV